MSGKGTKGRAAVRAEVAAWARSVRSHLSAIYLSTNELYEECRDNPDGLVAQAFPDVGELRDLLIKLEIAESQASHSLLPASEVLPDPLTVARRAAK